MTQNKYAEMETHTIKNCPPSNSQSLLDLYHGIMQVSHRTDDLMEMTRLGFYYNQIREVIERYYDLGALVEIYQIFGGYINTTFGIYTEKNGIRQTWLLRKYKRGKEMESLLFEHKLLLHARKKGYLLGAAPILNKEGQTFQMVKQIMPEGEEDFYFAVFNYIEGTNKYDWIPNWATDNVSEVTITSAAKAMAQFHNAAKDYDPEGRHGDNIMDNEDIMVNDLMKKFPQTLKDYRQSYAQADYENVYTEFYDTSYDFMAQMCQESVIPEADYQQMIILPCHCDFHPGNFKYAEDGSVCGSFDYDMAKIDARLFEIGLAMHYCFTSWKPENNGQLILDRVKKFIQTYNGELVSIGDLAPLSPIEKKYLYEVLVQGTLYVIGWCSSAVVYDTTLNPYEYFYYLQHLMACLHWIQDHQEEICDLAESL